MTGKIFNDNKDLTAGIDEHVSLGWRIVAVIAPWVLAAGVAYCGFQIVLACGVTL